MGVVVIVQTVQYYIIHNIGQVFAYFGLKKRSSQSAPQNAAIKFALLFLIEKGMEKCIILSR